MQKILIVRVSSLGDVVHNMPVIADIRRRHPDAQIDWLVEESFVDLVKLVDGVRNVLPFSLRRWRKKPFSGATWREIRAFRQRLAAEQYDLVIDCQGLIKTAWVASWARGPLVGPATAPTAPATSGPCASSIASACRSRRARTSSSARGNSSRPRWATRRRRRPIRSSSASKRARRRSRWPAGLNLPVPYVVFVHATSRADKQWPDAAWIELGQALVRRGASLVLPWGNDAERATSERLAQAFGAAAIVPPKLSLPAVVGLIDGADAIVGVDTGLVHIAAALKRPTVELYNFATVLADRRLLVAERRQSRHGGAAPSIAQVKSALAGFGLL